MAAVGILFVLVVLALVVIWVWALVDSIGRPDWAFVQAGSNKALWIILTVVLGGLGGGIYLLAVRPGVQRAQAKGPPVSRFTAPPAPSRFCNGCGQPATSTNRFCSSCGVLLS